MPLLVTTANSSVYSTSTTHRLFSLWLVVRSSAPEALPFVHSQALRIYSGTPLGRESFVSDSGTGIGVAVGAGVAIGGDDAGADAITILWEEVVGGTGVDTTDGIDVAVSVGVGGLVGVGVDDSSPTGEEVETKFGVTVGSSIAIFVGNGVKVEVAVRVSSFTAV